MAQEYNINSSGNANRPFSADLQIQPHRCENPKACWDSHNNKACIVYRRDSNNQSKMTFASITPAGSRYIVASGEELTIYANATSYEPRVCDCKSNRILAITNNESNWLKGNPVIHEKN